MAKSANQHDRKRKNVSEDYARAVQSPGTGCCCSPVPKGVVAKLAGYTDDEIAALAAASVIRT